MIEISQEGPEDYWEVEALFDLCFAPGRKALSSYRLRDDRPPVAELCLLGRQDGVLGAAIRYWEVMVGPAKCLLLGPVTVHPTRQGEGWGGMMIAQSLERARALGYRRVLLVGDAPYYARFGFTQLRNVKMPAPTNPERVLGRALFPNAWDGVEGTVTRPKL